VAGGFFHTASKGQKHKSYPTKLKAAIPKKETLHNNDVTSLGHHIQLVEEWIEPYSTARIKNRNL